MKISVIVPIYNTSYFLNRCIESIVNQTYKNIQILLIDDGSTDNSSDICKKWCEIDDRILYLKKENGGLSDARNYGIEHSKGEFLCFVDSDDFILPNFVEKLYNMATEHSCKISMCGFHIIDENTTLEQVGLPLVAYDDEVIDAYNYFLRIYTKQEVSHVVAWNKLYHKSIFSDIRFCVGHIHEDEEIIHKTIQQCDKVAICYESLYMYTVRKNSIMTSGLSEKSFDIFTFYQNRINYFLSKNYLNLAFFTQKNYMVACLNIYNNLNLSVENYEDYRYHALNLFNQMFFQTLKNPANSKKFMLKILKYKFQPGKFKGINREDLLF